MPEENHNHQNEARNQISNLGAVVLCGGKSSRLGIDKTRLDFKGQTFLERVVAQVRQVCDRVVIVGNTDLSFHRLTADVGVASDEAVNKGPLEGIRVGLERLAMAAEGQTECEFAFVTSCDVPLLKPELIRYLFAQLDKHQAVVPVQGDRIFGMTAMYRCLHHIEIGNRIAADQLRVSDLAAAFNAQCLDVETLREVDPELDSFTNINSVDDYRNLLKRFGLNCPPELAKSIGLD